MRDDLKIKIGFFLGLVLFLGMTFLASYQHKRIIFLEEVVDRQVIEIQRAHENVTAEREKWEQRFEEWGIYLYENETN